jgi:hypothetical protein
MATALFHEKGAVFPNKTSLLPSSLTTSRSCRPLNTPETLHRTPLIPSGEIYLWEKHDLLVGHQVFRRRRELLSQGDIVLAPDDFHRELHPLGGAALRLPVAPPTCPVVVDAGGQGDRSGEGVDVPAERLLFLLQTYSSILLFFHRLDFLSSSSFILFIRLSTYFFSPFLPASRIFFLCFPM